MNDYLSWPTPSFPFLPDPHATMDDDLFEFVDMALPADATGWAPWFRCFGEFMLYFNFLWFYVRNILFTVQGLIGCASFQQTKRIMNLTLVNFSVKMIQCHITHQFSWSKDPSLEGLGDNGHQGTPHALPIGFLPSTWLTQGTNQAELQNQSTISRSTFGVIISSDLLW